ncbi:hypothetical protein DXG01_001478 [Tephrocybe rancida]|nr:hypothetical protein DXG01_001478 [Tephrocybe rancida]
MYLDKLLCNEGRGDTRLQDECVDCIGRKAVTPAEAEVCCMDCFGPELCWTGTNFVKTSLKELGLTVQLNHLSMCCSNPQPCAVQMRVLHTNGFHNIALSYCSCRPLPPHIQLLQWGLYPASQLVVKTCATFELLQHLHILGLATKSSTYDFYRTLKKLTDNTGLEVPTTHYKALQQMCLQWWHLLMLKRGGRGHDSSGAGGTGRGSLQYLNALSVAMDANFHLKQQLVSSHSQDLGFGTGLSYMVKREPYKAYLLSKASQGDISTCVGFSALA